MLGPQPLVNGAHGMERTATGRDGFCFCFGSRMLNSDRGMSLGADLHVGHACTVVAGRCVVRADSAQRERSAVRRPYRVRQGELE